MNSNKNEIYSTIATGMLVFGMIMYQKWDKHTVWKKTDIGFSIDWWGLFTFGLAILAYAIAAFMTAMITYLFYKAIMHIHWRLTKQAREFTEQIYQNYEIANKQHKELKDDLRHYGKVIKELEKRFDSQKEFLGDISRFTGYEAEILLQKALESHFE